MIIINLFKQNNSREMLLMLRIKILITLLYYIQKYNQKLLKIRHMKMYKFNLLRNHHFLSIQKAKKNKQICTNKVNLKMNKKSIHPIIAVLYNYPKIT